jgi:hypothetical protein
MRDGPFEVMPTAGRVMPLWRIAAHGLYTLLVVPLALLVAAALTPVTRRWERQQRVPCRNCGYRMPAIEQHCPECRAAFRAEDA